MDEELTNKNHDDYDLREEYDLTQLPIVTEALRGLRETPHLLRSRRNAERLRRAWARSERNEGQPQSLRELQAEVGLDEE